MGKETGGSQYEPSALERELADVANEAASVLAWLQEGLPSDEPAQAGWYATRKVHIDEFFCPAIEWYKGRDAELWNLLKVARRSGVLWIKLLSANPVLAESPVTEWSGRRYRELFATLRETEFLLRRFAQRALSGPPPPEGEDHSRAMSRLIANVWPELWSAYNHGGSPKQFAIARIAYVLGHNFGCQYPSDESSWRALGEALSLRVPETITDKWIKDVLVPRMKVRWHAMKDLPTTVTL